MGGARQEISVQAVKTSQQSQETIKVYSVASNSEVFDLSLRHRLRPVQKKHLQL